MSQYLSSFIIDPVVRQARRFSRPASDSPHPEPRLSIQGTTGAPLQHDQLAETSLATHEGFPPLSLSVGDLPAAASTVTGDQVVRSPTPLEELSHADPHAWEDVRSDHDSIPLQLAETPNSEREVASQRHTLADNSLYSINDGLRSTTSSFSNSARSIIDATMSSADRSASVSSAQDTRGRGDSGSRSIDALPADDGMGHMRKRIIAIQRTDSSNEVKAKLVHGLMTEKHNSSQQSLQAPRAHSPGSVHSSERPFTPSSPKSMVSLRQTLSPPPSSSSNGGPVDPLQLSPDDLKPTFYRLPASHRRGGDSDEASMEVEEEPKALGCEHYKRNIKLQCSACHRWYTCRFCHDAAEDHMLNRRETKNMLCMLCGSAQPASEECTTCNVRAAWYYCDLCKLWDDSLEKSIYHCNDCGICRVGEGLGKDFFHCMTCSVCMAISIRDTHKCIERSTDCDCPICGEYMFTSPQTVVFMRCGHSIHSRCYHQHMKTSYKCPICSRSVVNMECQFQALGQAIEAQPMPPEFQDTKAWVSCNDCSAKTMVKYHWLGLKCVVCDSYNTTQLQLFSGPEAEARSSHIEFSTNVASQDSRGRPRRPNHSRQSTNSAPPSAITISREILGGNPWSEQTRYAQSVAPTGTQLTPPSSASNSDPDDSMDTDEEEVDFWGGESPRFRLSSPVQGQEMAVDDSGEEDEDDSEDGMSDDDPEEDEADDYNRMDLLGHR